MLSLVRLIPIALFLFAVPLAAAPKRVVAIGDIHGEYEGFVSILQKAGLINQRLQWTGGNTTLVQTGDFLDRGADVRKVMDLLMNLERAAGRRRGKVIVLLGNHELMNLTSALHDANPASYAAFADRNSEKRRKNAFTQYVALHERLAERYPGAVIPRLDEPEWMEKHPPGFIEYQEALGRYGKYGRWLRSKQAVVKVDDTVFLHGGISPEAPVRTIQKINDQIRLEIEGFDRIRDYLVAQRLILPFFTFSEISSIVDLELARPEEKPEDLRRVLTAFKSVTYWTIYDPEGPLWFRGFGQWSDEEGEKHLDALLSRFDARRFVVGHTIPQDASQILSRFGGRVFLIDTGMLRNYATNGRPAALEIQGDRYAAIYESGRVSLNGGSPQSSRRGPPARPVYLLASLSQAEDAAAPPAPFVWLGPDDTTLPFRTAAEVADFLRRAKLIKVQRKRLTGVTKPQKILVGSGSVRAHAVFRAQHREEENAHWESGKFTEFLRDTYKSELAAYELSLLLGLDNVPPTVPWQMKRRSGALQLFIEKARPGWHPSAMERPSDPVRWAQEQDKMRVFDALIGNTDRHENNILVDSTGKVWWIDHSRSFGRETDLIGGELIQRCERGLWKGLQRLDPDAAAERLSAYMSKREIAALLERRTRLIALVNQLIAERGEAAVLYTISPDGPILRTIRNAA